MHAQSVADKKGRDEHPSYVAAHSPQQTIQDTMLAKMPFSLFMLSPCWSKSLLFLCARTVFSAIFVIFVVPDTVAEYAVVELGVDDVKRFL